MVHILIWKHLKIFWDKVWLRHLRTPAAWKEVAGTVVTGISGVLTGENFLFLQATIREKIHLKAWTLWGLGHSQAAPLIPHWGGHVKVSKVTQILNLPSKCKIIIKTICPIGGSRLLNQSLLCHSIGSYPTKADSRPTCPHPWGRRSRTDTRTTEGAGPAPSARKQMERFQGTGMRCDAWVSKFPMLVDSLG